MRISLGCVRETRNVLSFRRHCARAKVCATLGKLLLRIINGVAAKFGASKRIISECCAGGADVSLRVLQPEVAHCRRIRKTSLKLVVLLV
ncbi:50S Ribosomal protein L22p/L17e [Candidatus Hodgkinia cicadicola]|nr:50S Ribosomal protein L22p/L17e [Candidatus Hodgkinia cicadicola]